MSRRRALAGLIVTAVLAACTTSPGRATPTTSDPAAVRTAACHDAAAALVAAVGRVVSVYDTPPAGPQARPSTRSVPSATASSPSGPKTTDSTGAGASSRAVASSGTSTRAVAGQGESLSDAVDTARRAMASNDCPTAVFASDLTGGLASLRPRGTIAATVLARVTAMLTGRLGATAETRTVGTATEVLAALTEVAPGSTIVLRAGDYRFTESLVLLDGVALRGAGPTTTVLHSSAAEAGVVVLTGARVDLADLTILLDGPAASSGVVAGPEASVALRRVRVSGARIGTDGLGGAGVQMSGTGTEGAGRGTTLEITDTELDHNGWTGIAVGGGHRASILRTQFTGNGQCGVCFFGTADGSVQDGKFTDNGVALGATESSAPTWLGNVVTGGSVGVQIDGGAVPRIDGLLVTGATRASVVYSSRSGGSITGAICRSSPYGIVVSDAATPTIGSITCPVARLAGG